jgi:transcriptional regulator with XRE-family HTH domain
MRRHKSLFVARQKQARSKSATGEPLLGSMLRRLRQDRNVPLRVVAAAAEMDSTLLSKVELNQRIPTPAQTAALARFFGIARGELEAERIATKFWQDFGKSPAAGKAVLLLQEQAGKYKARKSGKEL